MRQNLHKAIVWVAEQAGWLTSVDEEIVKDYLSGHQGKAREEAMQPSREWDAIWRSSTFCSYLFWCVEVACDGDRVAVRNSSDPERTTITFTLHEWQAFIKGVKAGEFDFPSYQVQGDVQRPSNETVKKPQLQKFL